MLKVAIVEDESECVNDLKSCLSSFCAQKEESFDADVYADAEGFLRTDSTIYDIVFLDVKLPGMDGIAAGVELREKNDSVVIIFVTTMAHMAVEGYQCHALDYLIKPLKYSHFEFAMDRAIHIARDLKKKLMLTETDGGIRYVSYSDVLYIENFERKLRWHINGDTLVTAGSLRDAEKALADDSFYRLSRGMLINLKYARLTPPGQLSIGDIICPLTKKQYIAVMNEISRYLSR